MSTNDLAKRFLIGLSLGVGTMFAITAVVLPASYVMNKLIYHAAPMRIAAGIMAGLFSVVSLLIMLIIWVTGNLPQVYYFGLWPIIEMQPAKGGYTGWLSSLFTIFSYIFHPFIAFYSGTPEEKEGYKNAMAHLLVKDGPELEYKGMKYVQGAVCEAFFEDARKAGAIANQPDWVAAVSALSETGKQIFTSV